MLPLKIIIADDEREARELLIYFLQPHFPLTIRECADGQSTLRELQSFQPDILFLDIRMPELSGIELLQKRPGYLPPAIVFTTAYDQYAIPAFDFEAVDYLLKPFERERFEKAFKRSLDQVNSSRKNDNPSYQTQIKVKTGSKIDVVRLQDVLYVQSEGAYVRIVTSEKSFLLNEPLYAIEQKLNPDVFARIHRSIIVNLNAVKSIHSLLNGDHVLILSDGIELRASRTYRSNLKRITG